MKKKLLLGIVLTMLLLAGCQSQADATEEIIETGASADSVDLEGEAFALYLIADDQLAGSDLADYDLDELPLAETPVIATDDLVNYNWDYHSFDLTENAYLSMLAIFSSGMPMSGVPFVIVSQGERIYAGAFWSPSSSNTFDGVVILQPVDPSGGSFFITLGYPTDEYFTGEDPRGDPGLKEALQAVGVISLN